MLQSSGTGGRGKAIAGELRKMMGVIVVVCTPLASPYRRPRLKLQVFMCLPTKRMPESTAIFSVEASGLGAQPNERFRIPRGERQPQCRLVHRSRPAHTQRIVQLLEVHPQAVRPTERSPQPQNPDAGSRGTRHNAVRLSQVKPARVPLRHVTLGPPQVPDLLHRLVKEQSHRPLDLFLI